MPFLVTEYEQLLSEMLKERREKLEVLKSSEGKRNQKKLDSLLSEISFIQVELQRYQHGLMLFRSKERPKVGRWGKPETGQSGEPAPTP